MSSTMTIIYRCSKPCEKKQGKKIAKRVTFTVRSHKSLPDKFGYERVLSRDFIAPWGEEFRRYLPHQVPYILCEHCRMFMGGKPLQGTQNDSVPCDRRCTSATGHNCECSCGGANHGIDHG